MGVKSYIYIGAAIISALSSGCSNSDSNSKYELPLKSPLKSESDSLAYIIGMNVARELQKMDSLINYEVVCRAIMEQSTQSSLMSDEEARTKYLRYILYVDPERSRAIEEQWLKDLALADRSYTRTKTGLTYNIEVIGDEKHQPKSANDWLTIRYKIKNINGEQLYPADSETIEESLPLSELTNGVEEAVKMIGKGGKIRMWIPSVLAYAEGGNEKLGVKPHETISYELELVDLDKGAAEKHRKAEF